MILYRVNTGGPQLASADGSTPDWSEDTDINPSSFRIGSGGSNVSTLADAIDLSDPSLPSSAPEALFQSERWDPIQEPEMQWEFPVDPGSEVEVRLYFAETFPLFIDASGKRVFDVSVEGVVPTAFDDIDPFQIGGGEYAGFMLSHTVTVNDNGVSLEFLHGIENPALKGIEIIFNDDPVGTNDVSIVTASDAAEPNVNGQFTVSLTEVAATDTTVTYTVAGTATPDTDYGLLSGTVIIPAGSLSAPIDVTVIDDTEVDVDETIIVTFTGTTGDANIALSASTEATVTITDDDTAAAEFGLNDDLDQDGLLNSVDDDIDGDGTFNLDDRTAYRKDSLAAPTFTETAPIVLDFSALSDGSTPFEGGFTGLAQTSDGSPELNYVDNTASGDGVTTAPAEVQSGRLVLQTTNDDTAVADSGFTFLADTEGESFVFVGRFDNPVFNATDLPTFSQYGLIVSLTGANGVAGADFVKLTTGNPGGVVELSGAGSFGSVPKPPLPTGVNQTNYAQVVLSLEGTVLGSSVTLVGKASYLDSNGDVLGEVTTAGGTVTTGSPLYNALTGTSGAPAVAFGITSTDFGAGGSFAVGVQNLSLSKPEVVVVEPPGPNFGLEVLAGLDAADGIATGGSYTQGEVGSAELDVMSTVNNIQSSNFGAGSFQLTNTGDKKIAALFIDFREALFGDSIVDFDGSAGDTAFKKFQTDSGAIETGAFFDPSNANVYYLPGNPPLPNTTGAGNASSGGFRGLLLKAGTVNGGFESGETVGFSGDMDPNSIAGLPKANVDNNAILSWDVGGISGAEIAGSKFFLLFDDGTSATGVLSNNDTQAGSIGKAVEGQAEVPVTVQVNGGSGVYGAGGVTPTIVVSGSPGQLVQVVLAKGLQPVTNDTPSDGGTTGPKTLVFDQLAISHPEFPVNNAFDFQTFAVTIGADGTFTVPAGAFTYSTTNSGVSFPGSDVAPIVISAVAIDNQGFAIGAVDRDYLTNPTATPVTDVEPGSPGYFTPSGSGNNLFYKIQIEDAAALNGGINPNGKWNYVTAPDSEGRQAGFQGGGYYLYGSNTNTGINNVIEDEILEFEIDVPEALVGKTLTFRIRASRDGVAESDQQNDIWFGVQHADGTGSIDEFLVGNGTSEPEPTSNGFIKVFGGPNNGSWGYASGVDGAPNNFKATIEFSEAGRYVLQVAGRSQGFHADWIELYTGFAPGNGAADSIFVSTGAQPVVLVNEIADLVFADGTTDTFQVPTNVFEDPNGDAITYDITVSATNGSDVSSVVINPNTGLISGLSGLAIDTYTVTIVASDPDGSASDIFDIAIVDEIALETLTIQGESITNVTGYRIENDPDADGGAMLSFLGGANDETGTATFTFNGVSGTYEVILGVFDENDGVATLEVAKNGSSIGSVLLDQNLGSNGATVTTKVEKSVATGVSIATGDTITVTGFENAGEHARFDFIRFEPDVPAAPQVSIATGQNGNEEGPINGEFTVSLSEVATSDTVVSYNVGGSATAGSDYTALSASVTIPANQQSATIAVPVIDDTEIEADESVIVTLTGASGSNALLGSASEASLLIEDNEVTNEVSIAGTTLAREPATDGEFTVSLDAVAGTDTVISYIVGGSATEGTDYAALSGTVTIPAGQTLAMIGVSVIDDQLEEGDETVIVTLDNITAGDANVVIGPTNAATVNIADDDEPIDPIIIEAEDITALPNANVTGYRVENDADADGGSMLSFVGGANDETGTATFTFNGVSSIYNVVLAAFDENDGAPAASLQVDIAGNTIGTVVLDQNPGGNAASPDTRVERSVAEVLITNGDTITVTGFESGSEHARFDFIRFEPVGSAVPEVSIMATQDGAEAGPVNGEFTVSLSEVVTSDTVVSYNVGGSATAGNDYTALSGSVTIPAGQTLAMIGVPVIDDGESEGDETVIVSLDAIAPGDVDVVLGATNVATLILGDDDGPLPTTVTIEAEDADTILNYRTESIGAASGGSALSFVGGAGGESGSSGFVFGDTPDELAGTYNIVIGTFDENDGLASFNLDLTDVETGTTTEIGSLVLDANLGSGVANASTFVSPTVATGISLTAGDVITVNGFENASEHARLDYLQLVPTV